MRVRLREYKARGSRVGGRFVRIALAAVLAFGMAPTLAFAGESEVSPEPQMQLTVQAGASDLQAQADSTYVLTYSYNTNDRTATVTGFTGTASGDLNIPATVFHGGETYMVTAIGPSAFKSEDGSESGFTGIGFAQGSQLASIGAQAFEDNWHITGGIDLPDSVTSIGARAFHNTGLRVYDPRTSTTEPAGAEGPLHLPANLKTIGEEAFSVCSFSGDLVIPAGITSIGAEAFYYAGFTGSLSLPEGMTAIPEGCFYDCDFTGSLALPSTLTTIGEDAFGSCNALSGSLTIPSGVTQIPDWAFSGFGSESGLCGELVLPSGLKSIGYGAFGGAGFTGALDIPDSVESIGESAFSGCWRFSSLRLPSNPNFTEIPDEAFGSMWSDEVMGFSGALVVPDSVTSIGESAFKGCGFTSLELSANLKSIADSAFDRCQALTGTLALPSTLETIGEKAFFFCDNLTGLTIADGVVSIGDDAFYGCLKAGGDLIIPGSVKTIGENAFCQFGSEATQMGALVIESGVESIGDEAFSSCNGFTSVSVPESVSLANMGTNVFEFSTKIASATLPDAWTAVPEGVFYGCSSLEQLAIPASATSIGRNAFRLCEGLTGDLEIPSGITEIGESAFYECTGLDGTLTIPEGVTSIGGAAFYGCENLTGTLSIPSSVTSLGSSWSGGIFQGCKGLTSLEMNQSCATLPESLFSGCTGLTGDIVIPSVVTKLETNVFRNCSGLDGALTIPSSVTTISGTPFYGTNFATIENSSSVALNVSDISPAYNVGYEIGGSGDGTIGQGTYTRVVGEPIDITGSADIVITAPDQTYDGTAKEHTTWLGSSLVVKYNGKQLSRNTHYRADYTDNVNAGTATVTIVGLSEGGFTGSKSMTFTIKPKSITPTIELSSYAFAYDGTAKEPDVVVKDGSTIVDPENYDVAFANNTERGAASVTVTMKGNYAGGKTAYFYIRDNQAITASDVTVPAGKTVALDAVANGGGWLWFESSDEEVATVDYNGVVTGVKAGTATITIYAGETSEYNAATATITVTVGQGTQAITADDLFVLTGNTAALGAMTDGDGILSYASSDPAIASVDDSGVVTGVSAGTATITVTAAETESFAQAVRVVMVTVADKSDQIITASDKTVQAGKTVALGASTNGGGALSYASLNTAVATVSAAGVITGVKAGTATIVVMAAETGEYAAATKAITITVTAAPTPAPTLKAQTVTAADKTVQTKKTVALGAKASAGGALSYKSSDTAVATVSAAGVVTGVKAGTTKITITAAKTSTHAAASKIVTVTVKNANTLKTKSQAKKLSLKTLKKKPLSFTASVIKTKGKGTVTYAKKKVTSKYKKYVTVSKSGKIKVKKGAKKGKCVFTLTVKATGSSKYMPATKTAKVTIAIK